MCHVTLHMFLIERKGGKNTLILPLFSLIPDVVLLFLSLIVQASPVKLCRMTRYNPEHTLKFACGAKYKKFNVPLG